MVSEQEYQQVEQRGAAAGGDSPPPPPPQPTASEVAACQFSSWYASFRDMDVAAIRNNATKKKKRKNVTIESVVIRPLPAEFIEYLSSDGVRLPECATRVSSCMNDGDADADDRWDSSSDEEDDDGGSSRERPKRYSFPDLTEEIQSALTRLGGDRKLGCMPKLNWSSPRDATWINQGSLKCTTVGDVYLLLKSSDFVGFDIEKAWDGLADDDAVDEMGSLSIHEPPQVTPATSEDSATNDAAMSSSTTNDGGGVHKPRDFEYELVLRKWCNLHPSMEFRCFVYDHELVAVSQRHPSKFYPHLQPPSDGSIHPSVAIIHAFFQTYIQERFAQGKIHRYVVDIYLDSQERVWVVDFNVWGERTDGLLFDWEELTALGRGGARPVGDAGNSAPMPETRVVTKDMKAMTYDPLSSYRGPTDVMDLMSGGGGDDVGGIPSFEEFMKQCVRPSKM